MAKADANQSGIKKRILRIGVILGGKIIEERLLRNRQTITVGQSQKNTFGIPIESLPKEWPLFRLENDAYGLQFMDGMDGRISARGKVQSLDELKSSGATKRDGHWFVPLDERSRGKIVLGEMTLLFQFVTAPPLQPRPRLPASVRGSFADRIEPRLAIILGLSLLIHTAVAIYAYQRDKVVMTRTEKLAKLFEEDQFKDRVVAVTIDQPQISTDTEQAAEAEDDAPKVKKQTPKKQAASPKQPKSGGGDGGGNEATADEAAVAQAIANTSLVAAITGGEGEGSRYSKMSDTDQGAGLEKSIQNAKGNKIGTSGSGQSRVRGQNSGKIGGDKGSRVGGPGPGTGVAAKSEEKISRSKFSKVEDLSMTTLDPSQVTRLIKSRYMPGIKRCHEKTLKVDPTAQGRVNVRFTVGPTGKVTSAKVKGFNPTVDRCIQALATRWRFGAPKDDSGKPTSADFSMPFVLKPGN